MNKFRSPLVVSTSLVLFYALAFYMNWDLPKYGAIAIVVISLDTSGGSLRKGFMRMLGTTFGLIFGILILVLFLQNRWGNMFGIAIYVVVLMYFMQGSKYKYAWMVASFLPVVIWADSYMNQQYGFQYAVYRYLETSAGVLIYTIIDTLFLPKTASAKLNTSSKQLAEQMHDYFKHFDEGCLEEKLNFDIKELESKIVSNIGLNEATLLEAMTDTSLISEQKKVWKHLQLNTKKQIAALALLSQNKEIYENLGHKGKEYIISSNERIEDRLNRIDTLWALQSGQIKEDAINEIDNDLLMKAVQKINRSVLNDESSDVNRIYLLDYQRDMASLDQSTKNVLSDLLNIIGLDIPSEFDTNMDISQEKRIWWQPEKFKLALFPAVAFIMGYIFWIYTNPITGPSIPEMMIIMGLQVVYSNVSTHAYLKVLKVVAMIICLIIAPIYFFLLPALSTGIELLTVIFIYSFIATYLGAKANIIKILLLNTFVAMMGLSNQMSYSFYTLADGLLMFTIVLLGLAILLYIFNPRSASENIMIKVNGFFKTCVRIIQPVKVVKDQHKLSIRKESGSELILISKELRGLQKSLKAIPDNDDSYDKVGLLIDGLDSLSFKIINLENINNQIVKDSDSFNQSMQNSMEEINHKILDVFGSWTVLNDSEQLGKAENEIETIRKDVQEQLVVFKQTKKIENNTIEGSMDWFSLLGGFWALLNTMSSTQKRIYQIDWAVMNEKRF